MNITGIILSKNEELVIKECLESLSWCNEVIVVDDNSTDKTASIAQNTGVKVYTHSLENDFAAQRNFGLEKAKNEWVLFVDADERVSPALSFEIQQMLLTSLGENGFFIKREDFIWGKKLKYGEAGNMYLLRLAKKNAGKWIGEVHEKWEIKGKIGKLQNPLLHYPHQSLSEFLTEINFYTDLRAKSLHKKGVKSSGIQIILYTKAKFFINYFLRLGFLDGIEGLLCALLMSLHSFLVRSKLWLLWQKK